MGLVCVFCHLVFAISLTSSLFQGKTVQMATFIGNIATKWKAFPALVVVPNSTITNWVREFERWAPNLRVVPFYGERKARDIIREFELFHHKVPDKFTNAKFHVLITTYEGITGTKDWGTVFKRQPRWEVGLAHFDFSTQNKTNLFSGTCRRRGTTT